MAYLENQREQNGNSYPEMDSVFNVFSRLGEIMSHSDKVTKIYQTTKFVTVARYGRNYEIEFKYMNDQLEIWSVDGNTDVEDTYSESFLIDMEEKIKILSSMPEDTDDQYDDHFQNQ